MSGFYRTDKLIPVITITLYWGTKKWDAPRSIHEMFDNLDENLKRFIPDYRMNLVVPREIENFEKFETTLGAVLEAIKVSDDKEKMYQLIHTKPTFREMDYESVAAINLFTGANVKVNEPKGAVDMGKAWDDLRKEGIEEGRVETIRDFLDNGGTEEQARTMLKASEKEIRTAKERLGIID